MNISNTRCPWGSCKTEIAAAAITSLELNSDLGNYIGQDDYYYYSQESGNLSARKILTTV
ncbi:hypothetical protein QUB63_32245 [Microcoleus sp. ARI1-B5]|uniref:hypothetical protein n=1 Tax=unclassified Microcoleus TaxID=2642155 RepID=UPI002FD026D0